MGQKLITAITKERDARAAQLLNADPPWMRLQGMLDFASGNIKLVEKDDGTDKQDLGKTKAEAEDGS